MTDHPHYAHYGTGAPVVDTKAPEGPVAERWDTRRFQAKLVNPANRRKHTVIVVGTGLAGGSAGATLAEQGYHVVQFCFQDSPRRAHSVAAQGGINAAKNYRNDGDSIHRLFYDTVKGGDFRARESNVHRLAQISVEIIDQCVAQGVPFAREYGGLLDNRSFGGVQVSRTFYARGQTGQQLLLGAYQALSRQIAAGNVELHARTEMLDLIVIDGKARGIVARDLVTGKIDTYFADAVVLASGGYGNVFYLSTNAMNSNATAIWRAHRRGAYFANPCFTQIHPTCIPRTGDHQSKLTLMSESLRNDGRIWVPKAKGDDRPANEIPEDERDYYLERVYPAFGNLVPRDIASRAAKNVCDEGRGVGPGGQGVYLDFAEAIQRMGRDKVEEKYGNLFDMYARITAENPYETPMRIYPAVHYTMGGLWVDYDLQTTVPGLFAIGEANFSDHGANRLGASALMQGLADGYFVLPSTINDYLARNPHHDEVDASHPAVEEIVADTEDRLNLLLAVDGDRTPTPSTARSVNSCGNTAAWPAPRRAARGARPDPADPRGVLAPYQGARHRRRVQPVAGEGQPHRRLPGARRAHVPRRTAPRRILRRPLPRGVADPGRRGRPPGRGVLLRRRLGVHRHRRRPRPAQGRPGLRVRPPHPAELRMKLTLRVWRQKNADAPGAMSTYEVDGISRDMSFLEMLDTLNEELILEGDDPVAFDHDCREGICGACSLVINGDAHGPERTTTCQLHMRSFEDGDTIDIEPWRASAFPVVKDLVVDRSAFDRIIQAGGYISAPAGTAPEAHATPVPKPDADFAFEHAECIGCGACVAACPNGSAMLFTSAKINHLNVLPQGAPERETRVLDMVDRMDSEGFGGCTLTGECATACPKGIPLPSISAMNKEWLRAVRKVRR